MRVSTQMIFDSGVSNLQKRTSETLRLQQQLATNKRILKPSDDPVAAAQALEVTQAKSLNDLYMNNQANANDILALSESQIASAEDLLQVLHERVVQIGNSTLSDADRKSITTELRQRFEELMGIANQQDGLGNYLFSGFRGDTKPFTGSVDAGVTYNGDQGQRLLRVSASRDMRVSESGRDVFQSVSNDSIPFAIASSAVNKGSGNISAPTIVDATKWNDILNPKNFTIHFATIGGTTTYDIVDPNGVSILTNSPSQAANPPVTANLPAAYVTGQEISLAGVRDVLVAQRNSANTGAAAVTSATIPSTSTWNASSKNYTISFTSATTYDIVDNTTSTNVVTGAAYTSGAAINFFGASVVLTNSPTAPANGDKFAITASVPTIDYGATVKISGTPANGDSFSIRPTAPVSVFDTISAVVRAAEIPLDGTSEATRASYNEQVQTALANILSAQENMLKYRSEIGARMNELDSIGASSSQRELDYETTLTRLQDVDMTAAISDLNRTQITLQAAQLSFTKISQLSLFNYL